MRTLQLLLLGSLAFGASSTHGQFHSTDRDPLFKELRKHPTEQVMLNDQRVEVVNARYETCTEKRDVRYLRIMEAEGNGFLVRVIGQYGRPLMIGHTLDAEGRVPHGAFQYFDEAGTLRAEGSFTNGRKVGIWKRYDMMGQMLMEKEYDGLEWDEKQVKLGIATLSRTREASNTTTFPIVPDDGIEVRARF